MRLSLLPTLRQLWRDPRTVQLGTDPARAIVLEFSDPGASRALDLLDGSRTEEQILREARSTLAIDVPDVLTVLNALWAAGLLVDACALLPAGLPKHTRMRLLPEAASLALLGARSEPSWSSQAVARPRALQVGTPAQALQRRASARILVTGSERLAAPVALTLASAGVGHVVPVIEETADPSDLLEAIARSAPGTKVTPLRAGTAHLVVRVGYRPARVAGGKWRRAAVLSVAIRDGVALVGPLVLPGGSPCGRCLDLHRTDRDPAWPVLAAQLATAPSGVDSCSLTTAVAAAAYTAEEALSYVDGRPLRTHGAAVEISRPGESRRRSWRAHPLCGCVSSGRMVTDKESPQRRLPLPAGRNDE